MLKTIRLGCVYNNPNNRPESGRGAVYDSYGIAPTIVTMSGGIITHSQLCQERKYMKIAISALIQPKDREYLQKGECREERLEIREDEFCYNLRTGGQTLVVVRDE